MLLILRIRTVMLFRDHVILNIVITEKNIQN